MCDCRSLSAEFRTNDFSVLKILAYVLYCRLNYAPQRNPRLSHFPVKPDDVGTTVREGRGEPATASASVATFSANSVQMGKGRVVTCFERESKSVPELLRYGRKDRHSTCILTFRLVSATTVALNKQLVLRNLRVCL